MNPFFEYFQLNHALARIEKAATYEKRSLLLIDFDLTDVPEDLFKCVHLFSLFLARNRIQKLPLQIANLKNLHTLAIDHNNLEVFPKELTLLSHLKVLNISHNRIRDLTSDIGALTTLESLWCNSCGLTALPEEIGMLVILDILGARNNSIEELPDSICKLKKLRWLTLENNKLSVLPKYFFVLDSLVHLNLNGNKFISIPYQVSKLKKLRYLMMQNNDMSNINQFVLHKMTHVYKINLLHNPIVTSQDIIKKFNNLIMPGSESEVPVETEELNSDEGSEDWEGSINISDLDFANSDSGSDDEPMVEEYIPKLSKYLVTY